MTYAFLVIPTVIFIEMLYRIPVIASARCIFAVAQDSMQTVASKTLSDDQKQKALQTNGLQSFKHTFLLAFYLVIIVAAVAMSCMAGDALLKPVPGILETSASLKGVCLMTAYALAYVFLRKRFVKK